MGVDNNGILFLGLPESEVDLTVLPDFDADAAGDDRDYLRYTWGEVPGHPQFVFQEDNGYDPRVRFVGFKLADSGSYGYKEVEDLPGNLNRCALIFENWLGKRPKVFILNYQW